MAEFANVVVSDANARNQFLGSKASSVINGNSPFVDGIVLSGLSIDVAQSSWDGVVKDDAPLKLLFHTREGIDIPLTMLFAKKFGVDSDNKRVWVAPVGTFNAKAAALLSANANISVNDLASQLIAAAPNGIRVKRTAYSSVTRDGRAYPTSIVGFDIV